MSFPFFPVRSKPLPPLSPEDEALARLFDLMTGEEIVRFAGSWRSRYRESPSKFMRVLADLELSHKEGGHDIRSYSAVGNVLWKEFT